VTSTTTFQVRPPPLAIAGLADGRVEIRWAATSEALVVLEASEDLSPGGWQAVPDLPHRADGQTKVELWPTRLGFYWLEAE